MLRSTFEIRILTVFFAVVMLVGFFQGRVLAEGKKWTIMVFINGDNNLEGAGIDDINEMEKVGSTEDVNILVQFDRAPGFSYSDGDWTSTRRFYINKDNDPYKINSEMLRDLGEVDTGDYHSLVDFARWGMAEYPAEKLLLVVWNHGAGWKKKAEEPIFKGISYDDTSGNHMTTQDIEKALQEIVALRDGQKIDLLGMDACLMQMVEVSYQFRQYVDVCAASEEVEPGDGWAYEDFLAPLMAKPGMDARELGTVIVNTYIGSYSGGSQGNQAVTQSAIDCRKLDELVATIDGFAGTLLTNIKQIGRIKNCLKSTHSFYYDDYKDIGDLAKRISSTFKGGQLQTAAQGLLAKLDEAIIINGTNGSSQAASTGLSIYIPTKYQYKAKYENLAFSQACRWDEFLKASFDPPVPILNIKNIEIIDAGDDGKVSPGESLSLKVTVENTGGAASNGAVLKLSCQDEFVALTASSETLQPIPKKQSITFMGLAAEVSESCPANRRFELKVSLEDEGEKVTESSVDVMVRKPFSVTSNLLLAVPNINAKESKHFTKVLDDLEIPYDVWDIDFEGSMSKGVLFKYLGGIVIRSCPDNNGEGKIGSDEQAALAEYLDRGGSLFITGQDIGYGIHTSNLYKAYMHAEYVQDSSGIHDIGGISNTQLDGLSFRITGGSGADNQRWPDEINPIAPAVPVLKYVSGGKPVRYPPSERKPGSGKPSIDGSGTAGVYVEKDGFKVLYLAFGFEGIADADSRKVLMTTALELLSSSFQKKMQTLLGMEMTRHEFGTASLKVSRSIISEIMEDLDRGSVEKLDSFIGFMDELSEFEQKAFRSALAVIRERAVSGSMSDSSLSDELKIRINRLNELSR